MFIRGSLLSLVAMASSLFAGSPIPSTSTYLGDAKNVTVTGRNGDDPSGGGGSFNGTISGFSTTFWCVDSQLHFSYNSGALANVYTLDQIAANPAKVRYAGVTQTGSPRWTNNGTGNLNAQSLNDFSSFASFNTATQRYQAAAWLITQYNFNTANQPQTGIDNNNTMVNPGLIYSFAVTNSQRNADVQKTIWSLMHNTTPGADASGVDDGVKVWLDAAYANYNSVDMKKWAVVSWTVNASGVLQTDDRQTFLVQVVPEPGFYGVLAAGFVGLAFAARRRKLSV